MARDPLRTVRTVRLRSVDQARYALAACLKSEADVADRIRAIDAAARQDQVAFQAVENSYQFQEMFARREQARQADRRAALEDLTAAEARSAEARAAVATARMAAEAVETFIAERAATAAVESERREQHVLDDMARIRRF